MTMLRGAVVTLRPAVATDVSHLARIRSTREVLARWRGEPDMEGLLLEDLAATDIEILAIEHDGRVVGAIQWGQETDPEYRHANMDIYLDPAIHGRGLGTDTVRTLCRHLVAEHGFHRFVIDPAADNAAAIACYAKVGFRTVGVLRQYEKGADGTWHDGLLMELLADELR